MDSLPDTPPSSIPIGAGACTGSPDWPSDASSGLVCKTDGNFQVVSVVDGDPSSETLSFGGVSPSWGGITQGEPAIEVSYKMTQVNYENLPDYENINELPEDKLPVPYHDEVTLQLTVSNQSSQSVEITTLQMPMRLVLSHSEIDG
jgi:hypothetical protein